MARTLTKDEIFELPVEERLHLVEDDRISVLRVLHQARDPGEWQSKR